MVVVEGVGRCVNTFGFNEDENKWGEVASD